MFTKLSSFIQQQITGSLPSVSPWGGGYGYTYNMGCSFSYVPRHTPDNNLRDNTVQTRAYRTGNCC